MTDGLTYRKTSADTFRISFDGVEVGSVSKRADLQQREHWHFGVDVMPLMSHGGHVPTGDADTFADALAAFKAAFTTWHAALPPDLWRKNRDYIRAGAELWRRK